MKPPTSLSKFHFFMNVYLLSGSEDLSMSIARRCSDDMRSYYTPLSLPCRHPPRVRIWLFTRGKKYNESIAYITPTDGTLLESRVSVMSTFLYSTTFITLSPAPSHQHNACWLVRLALSIHRCPRRSYPDESLIEAAKVGIGAVL